jgi:hypothetical protein
MHDFAFSDAVQPDKYQILGLNLRDYTIGHEILLFRHRNAIVAPKEHFDLLPASQQRLALIRAVTVCARTWEENQKPFKWLNLWLWRNRNANISVGIADFRNYRASAQYVLPSPDLQVDYAANGPRQEGRSAGSPLTAQLINFISEKSYCKNPFNFPFSLALFLYLAHLEAEGNIKIENHKEMTWRLETEKHLADIEREQKEAACQTSA